MNELREALYDLAGMIADKIEEDEELQETVQIALTAMLEGLKEDRKKRR